MASWFEDEDFEKCSKLNCEIQGMHCCVDRDDPKNVTTYCCDVDEFINRHVMPPLPEMVSHAIVTPSLRPVTHNEVKTAAPTTMATTTTTIMPTVTNTTTILSELSKNAEPHALGWTYIGIASGIIVLLLFVLVMMTIIYILYHWRRKYGTGRAVSYVGARGHEVVVYTSSTGTGRHVEVPTMTISNGRHDDEGPSTSNQDADTAPPPYTPPRIITTKNAASNREDEIQVETRCLDPGNGKLLTTLPEP